MRGARLGHLYCERAQRWHEKILRASTPTAMVERQQVGRLIGVLGSSLNIMCAFTLKQHERHDMHEKLLQRVFTLRVKRRCALHLRAEAVEQYFLPRISARSNSLEAFSRIGAV